MAASRVEACVRVFSHFQRLFSAFSALFQRFFKSRRWLWCALVVVLGVEVEEERANELLANAIFL